MVLAIFILMFGASGGGPHEATVPALNVVNIVHVANQNDLDDYVPPQFHPARECYLVLRTVLTHGGIFLDMVGIALAKRKTIPPFSSFQRRHQKS